MRQDIEEKVLSQSARKIFLFLICVAAPIAYVCIRWVRLNQYICNVDRRRKVTPAVLSYADVFLMLTVLFLVLAVFGLLMKRPRPQAGAGAGH
jgi:hypothetical protein